MFLLFIDLLVSLVIHGFDDAFFFLLLSNGTYFSINLCRVVFNFLALSMLLQHLQFFAFASNHKSSVPCSSFHSCLSSS